MSPSLPDLSRDPIATPRLLLRPVRAEFAEATFAAVLASQDEFRRWFAWAGDPTLEATRQHFAANERQWGEGQVYAFAIFLGDDLVGDISLRIDSLYHELGTVGYWMGTAWAGQGYMTEAAAAVRDFGFDRLGLVRLQLLAGVANPGSQRVAEKLGMRREGRLRSVAWNGSGEPYDAYMYGMVRMDPKRDTGGRRIADGAETAITTPDFSGPGAGGLVTAVVQDQADGAVLMVAHMNEEAYRRTLETRRAWFWSRSRRQLWQKGETSGNLMDVDSVSIDCDGDAVLLRVHPHGPACHTGERSCFHNRAGG